LGEPRSVSEGVADPGTVSGETTPAPGGGAPGHGGGDVRAGTAVREHGPARGGGEARRSDPREAAPRSGRGAPADIGGDGRSRLRLPDSGAPERGRETRS